MNNTATMMVQDRAFNTCSSPILYYLLSLGDDGLLHSPGHWIRYIQFLSLALLWFGMQTLIVTSSKQSAVVLKENSCFLKRTWCCFLHFVIHLIYACINRISIYYIHFQHHLIYWVTWTKWRRACIVSWICCKFFSC